MKRKFWIWFAGIGCFLFLVILLFTYDFISDLKPNSLGTPKIRTSYPVEAYATEDSGFIVLHFTVDGTERAFLIDSGAYDSTYDPAQWDEEGRAQQKKISLYSGGLFLGTVKANDAKGSPLYKGPSVRPDGLLGQDFLSQVVLLFDPHHHKALLWPSKSADSKKLIAQLPNSKQSWPVDGFLDAWPRPWQWVDAEYDEDLKLYTWLKIGSKTLDCALDTGCTCTGVNVEKLDQFPHWEYASREGNFWSATALQRFFLVNDLRLPFTWSPVAAIDEVTPDPSTDAWVGLDMINRGRWVMDSSHHLFGFQAYSDRPPVRLSTPDGTLVIQPDGSFGWAPRIQSSEIDTLSTINGEPASKALGDLSDLGSNNLATQRLAANIQKLLAKPLDLGINEDGNSDELHFTPQEHRNLPSVAQISREQSSDGTVSGKFY